MPRRIWKKAMQSYITAQGLEIEEKLLWKYEEKDDTLLSTFTQFFNSTKFDFQIDYHFLSQLTKPGPRL